METQKKASDFIRKHKYVFFMIVSLVSACLSSFFVHLVQDTLSIKLWLNSTFFYWGFSYPIGFVAYENLE